MSIVEPGGRGLLIVISVLSALPAAARAQTHESHGRPLAVGASAVGLLTRASPALAGRALSEGYITQPVLLGMARWRAASAQLMVNLEGWTLDRGELNAGNAGEGYVDRRHPHTFLHEAIAAVQTERDGWSASIAAGRGFAPFGTDDPMVRPFIKYPANHHWSQILERWTAIAAVRRGPVLVEAGLFNGDEPMGPESLGRISRWGDSWAARLTLLPGHGLELQASHAGIESPEHATGGGLDQRKWSASARVETELDGVPLYGLVEWARTTEFSDGRRAFAFGSTLGEAAADLGAFRVAARFERTTRPEEERLESAFRSARPHADENIIGVTRWQIATVHAARRLHAGGIGVAPFVEVSFLRAEEITGSIFDAVEHYGSASQWSLSAGVRVGAGARHTRMGRYAVAVPVH